MADIRNSPLLDDFQRANETPLQPPWYQTESHPMNLVSNGIGGTAFPPAGSGDYYSAKSLGSRPTEVWGIASGGASALLDGTRIMLWQDPIARSGYVALPTEEPLGDTWFLRRYDNGIFTSLADINYPEPGANDIVMIRVAGSNVEFWHGTSSGTVWTNVATIGDNTYQGPFYGGLGSTGEEKGWKGFGGGKPKNLPQIYRIIRSTTT